MIRTTILLIALVALACQSKSQDPKRFESEISSLVDKHKNIQNIDVVFTGSSSVRLWQSLSEDCNQLSLINTAFGGSQMSDLLYYIDETIIRYKPKRLYIYEGDNDINDGKSPGQVMQTTKNLVDRLKQTLPELEIIFIGAKPSPARWQHKNNYLEFNRLLKAYTASNPYIKYIDVWTPMIDHRGLPDPSIFISDSLHMNDKGYKIWKQIICN